jgi:signal transduction histidine kinase
VLLVAACIAAGYRVRIRRLNQRFELVLAERSRIARELHDTLLQGLSGVTMQLQALWTKLPVGREKNFLGEIIKDAARTSQEARQSLWDLRSRTEEPVRLSDRLLTLANQLVSGQPLALHPDIQPLSLAGQTHVECQLLRIAQEAISNVVTHSGATDLYLDLHRKGDSVLLRVRDNGIGFVPGSRQRVGHFGFIGMRERAEEINGQLTISSDPGTGTTVQIEVQLLRSTSNESNPKSVSEHQLR